MDAGRKEGSWREISRSFTADPELQEVRTGLARLAEKSTVKANALLDDGGASAEVKGWVGVARLALHARALTDEDIPFDELDPPELEPKDE